MTALAVAGIIACAVFLLWYALYGQMLLMFAMDARSQRRAERQQHDANKYIKQVVDRIIAEYEKEFADG